MVEYSIETLDRTFRALANPTRRAILGRLASQRAATVVEIAEQFDMSLNGVSKHLKVLERAGLIQRKIEGRTHFCTIASEPLQMAEDWLADCRRFWEERLDALERFLQQQQDAKR